MFGGFSVFWIFFLQNVEQSAWAHLPLEAEATIFFIMQAIINIGDFLRQISQTILH